MAPWRTTILLECSKKSCSTVAYRSCINNCGSPQRHRMRVVTLLWYVVTAFCSSCSFLMSTTPAASEDFATVLMRCQQDCIRSSFAIRKKKTVYWKEGVLVTYDGGYFIVEAACPNATGLTSESKQGILITVQSTCNDYSAMSYIIDEIDDIVNDMYPGLVDEDEFGDHMLTSIAICQDCYPKVQDEMDSDMLNTIEHFRVESCLRAFMASETIECPQEHRVPLKQLVPEMLMTNLSKRYFVDKNKLHFESSSESRLGDGASGIVYKGRYKDENVAIKQFHVLTKAQTATTPSTDSGISLENYMEKSFSERLQESLEAKQLLSSFSEMRREVAILSRLKHPCIVTLKGISLRPLYMVLELAPLGSLKNLIDEHRLGKKSFNKYRDYGKVFPAHLPKNLTYKIIYQIGKALKYLHQNDIIYRDLKSENVLMWSVDTDAAINIKVSDYGISKFTTPQGMQGYAGTPGFQAPEILKGLAYDEKVDMFSYGMVIYEILSGRLPYSEYGAIAGPIGQAVISGKRPALQDYNIDSRFPYLNSVMTKCWSTDPNQRPAAADVTRKMLNVEFLCQEGIMEFPDNGVISHVDCMLTYTPSEDKAERLIWIWEGSGRYRRYHILDSENSQFRVFGEVCKGPLVTCMARVDNTMWVGTKDCEIEVYSSQVVGNPGCQQQIRVKSQPLALLYQARVGTEVGSKQTARVYAAMDNGTLTIFSLESLSSASWGQTKMLTLPSRDPATCMTLVNDDTEIWVACGTIIAVISTRTLMVERKIDALPSMTALLHVNRHVFCSVTDKCMIVEYDSTDYIRTCVFNLKGTSLHGCVVVKNDANKYLEPGDVEDGGSASVNTSERFPPVSEVCDTVTNSGVDADISSDVSSDLPPPVPPKKGHDTPASTITISGTDKDISSDVSVGQPPPIPPKKGRIKSDTDVPTIMDYGSAPIDLSASLTVTRRHDFVSRQRNITSLPRDTRLLDSDIQAEELVTSVLLVSDTLWVARSSGDIIVVNINRSEPHEFKYGQVLAVLTGHGWGKYCTPNYNPQLVLCKDIIVAAIDCQKHRNVEHKNTTELSSWQGYATDKFHDFNEYERKFNLEKTYILRQEK